MTSLALLFIGFSVFSAFALALTHFRREPYRDQGVARVAGLVLLLALGLLQGAHFALLQFGAGWVGSAGYRATLFIVAPAFYVFSQPILRPQAAAMPAWRIGVHLIPALGAWAMPGSLAMPLAFALGAAYLAWLARSLYALRQARSNFHLELLLLGVVFGLALAVTVLGLWGGAAPGRLFFSLYASAIGLAFLLVQVTLGLRPQLPVEVRDSAQAGYTATTLAKVDCDQALARLAALMQTERLYVDPDLSLAGLAGRLGLSAHQLSELVNDRLGKGFSRYLRERRVEAAQAMLLAEPRASVLSVGLSVGFSSPSNFYEAFREIVGSTPGQYRKLHAGPADRP
ncbi:MAG: AraC family transcriptional regulator [Burkholderiales bacterium]|nr:AraC family transcriptional regulator [Burkholderiales bacterium]